MLTELKKLFRQYKQSGLPMPKGLTPQISHSECVLSCSVVSDSCNPMDCSPPGSSVHGIFQVRMLEWVPFCPLGDLPDPGIEPASPMLADRFFTTSITCEALTLTIHLHFSEVDVFMRIIHETDKFQLFLEQCSHSLIGHPLLGSLMFRS